MIIRLADMNDVPRIAEMVILAGRELEQYGQVRIDDQLIAAIVGGVRDGEAVVVAEQDGELLGFTARVNLPGSVPEHAEGIGRYVVPGARGQGVDRDMQRFAEDHAWRLGRRYFTGSVMLTNETSIAACKASGWEIVGYLIRKDLGDGQEEGQAEAGTEADRVLGKGI